MAAGEAIRRYVFPLVQAVVTTHFGGAQARAAGYTGALPSEHAAIDIVAQGKDKTVYAPVSGTVQQVTNAGGTNWGYGNSVLILGDDGNTHRLAHFANPTEVKVGQKINAGQPLGIMGASGNATGPHTHWEVRDAKGNPVNPEKLTLAQGGQGAAPAMSDEQRSAMYQNTIAEMQRQATEVEGRINSNTAALAAANAIITGQDSYAAQRQAAKSPWTKTPQEQLQYDNALDQKEVLEKQLDLDRKTLPAIRADLATAQDKAQGKDVPEAQQALWRSQAAENEEQVKELRRKAAAIADPNSPERRSIESEIQSREAANRRIGALLQGEVALQGANVAQTNAQTNRINTLLPGEVAGQAANTEYTQEQAAQLRATRPYVVREAAARAGLTEQQANTFQQSLESELATAEANRGNLRATTANTQARTEELQKLLPSALRKAAADAGISELQLTELSQSLPARLAQAEAAAQVTQAQVGNTQAQTQASLAATDYQRLQTDALRREQAVWGEISRRILEGASPDEINQLMLAGSTNVRDFVAARQSIIQQKVAEDEAYRQRFQLGISQQQADTQQRQAAQEDIRGYEDIRLRGVQQSDEASRGRHLLGAGSTTPFLASQVGVLGEEGTRQLAGAMGLPSSVLNPVLEGYRLFQNQQNERRAQVPDVRRAPTLPTDFYNPVSFAPPTPSSNNMQSILSAVTNAAQQATARTPASVPGFVPPTQGATVTTGTGAPMSQGAAVAGATPDQLAVLDPNRLIRSR